MVYARALKIKFEIVKYYVKTSNCTIMDVLKLRLHPIDNGEAVDVTIDQPTYARFLAHMTRTIDEIHALLFVGVRSVAQICLV
jgi:hypothetical protein